MDKPYRKLKLGSELVSRALDVMRAEGADECVLEVESTNQVRPLGESAAMCARARFPFLPRLRVSSAVNECCFVTDKESRSPVCLFTYRGRFGCIRTSASSATSASPSKFWLCGPPLSASLCSSLASPPSTCQ